MSNLEELILFLFVVRRESTYIDGNHLYDEILIHMSQLNKFTFNISTTVYNNDASIDLPKQHSSAFITFHYLVHLRFDAAHGDYVEQFLFDTKTHLPHLFSIEIGYETSAIVTNNFTNDTTRVNCSQLKRLIIKEPYVRSENFHSYFPLL
jgi:hypothetical protein